MLHSPLRPSCSGSGQDLHQVDYTALRNGQAVQRWGGMGLVALLTQETFGTPGFTDDDA